MVRTLGDIQERLLFVTQTFLRDAICGYQAQPADLDYPNKLITAFRRERNAANSHEDSIASIYQSWYPPLEKVVDIHYPCGVCALCRCLRNTAGFPHALCTPP
jgi:Conserved oligomeric Golgi complex subunit 3, C-terminal